MMCTLSLTHDTVAAAHFFRPATKIIEKTSSFIPACFGVTRGVTDPSRTCSSRYATCLLALEGIRLHTLHIKNLESASLSSLGKGTPCKFHDHSMLPLPILCFE